MSALQQELQNELITANQLLQLISRELQEIKQLTSPGEKFEVSIKESTSLVATLAKLRQINIENLPPMIRRQIDLGNNADQSMSYEQHETFRDSSDMETN